MTNLLRMKIDLLNIRLKSRIEKASVFYHILVNSLFNVVSCYILYRMLFTNLASLVYLYFAWMWWDWNSPYNGSYVSRYFLNLQMHKAFAEYFPLKLHITSELPDDQNYLIGMHPHGVCCMSSYHFMSNGTGIWDRFPKIKFHTCTLVKRFWFPLCREWLMLHGVINCSRESLHNVLGGTQKGQAAVLVVGGAEESLDAHPGKYVIMLSRRKGFIKIAIETGAFLVPCFAFGENDIYRQANNDEGTIVRRIQKFVKKYWGVSPLMVYGTGVFFAYGFMPFRKPLNSVLGAPIPVKKIEKPTQEQIDELHSIYIQRLTELFEDHKEKYGMAADIHLIIR